MATSTCLCCGLPRSRWLSSGRAGSRSTTPPVSASPAGPAAASLSVWPSSPLPACWLRSGGRSPRLSRLSRAEVNFLGRTALHVRPGSAQLRQQGNERECPVVEVQANQDLIPCEGELDGREYLIGSFRKHLIDAHDRGRRRQSVGAVLPAVVHPEVVCLKDRIVVTECGHVRPLRGRRETGLASCSCRSRRCRRGCRRGWPRDRSRRRLRSS